MTQNSDGDLKCNVTFFDAQPRTICTLLQSADVDIHFFIREKRRNFT